MIRAPVCIKCCLHYIIANKFVCLAGADLGSPERREKQSSGSLEQGVWPEAMYRVFFNL